MVLETMELGLTCETAGVAYLLRCSFCMDSEMTPVPWQEGHSVGQDINPVPWQDLQVSFIFFEESS